ncbi:pyridoxamine 5'-phosphate oxidase family protein [Streptomyces nogalater]
MAIDESLIERTAHLLDRARYLNLATSRDGAPWVATLEYAWFAGPLRFVFGSSTGARHSGDIRADPRVSGSLFVTEGAAGVAFASVDGAQFTGRCTEIGPGNWRRTTRPSTRRCSPTPGSAPGGSCRRSGCGGRAAPSVPGRCRALVADRHPALGGGPYRPPGPAAPGRRHTGPAVRPRTGAGGVP